ncbi:MAG: acyltransferase domain-containing protein, partial [Planctomycetes bacterium]|nr:acyltransferase domain-containing protein [Planctomycetota bacterium]
MSQRDPFTPLAITGLGCLFPGKPGTRGFWNTVLQGIDQIRDIPADRWKPSDHFDPDPSRRDMVYAARGAFLSPVPFSPAEYGVTPASLEATDTAQLLGLHVARQALLDAGYAALPRDPGKPLPRDRASVIVGVTSALELLIPLGARLDHPRWRRAMREAGIPEDRINDALARIASTYPEWTEDSFPGLLGNVVAGRIASRFDLHGTNCVVDAACASSLAAVHQAAMELQSGRADIVVTGGIDTFTDVFMYACFSKTPALSRRGEARPFAADADGTILGEGLGLVVLKRLPDALRDGDAVHAVIKGLGTSSDGRGQAIYAPAREGQARAVRRAWAQAGVGAGDIGLVEAHGTGTKAGDGVELSALLELFGKSGREGPWCALGSVKSQIGHAKGAAGAAGLVKAALALRHRVLPPTLKTESERAEFAAADSPFFLPRKARHWPAPAGGRPRRAAVSAFGFGGSNFHAVLEEHGPPASPAWDGSVEILAWGAADWPGIESSIAKIPDPQGPLFPPFARMCRESFDPSSPVRLAVAWAGGDREALLAACREAIAAARDGRAAQGPARAATGPAPRRPVLLFPGQGSQKAGMFRELACVFPEVAAELDAAAAAMAARFPEMPALDRIVDPVRATASDTLSTDTRACQAALAATGLGAARLLERFGIGAWAACGHSLGELPALAWAGRLPAESMHHLVAVRSGAMRDAGQSFAGAMAAVLAPRDRVVALLASDPSLAEVVPANHNGPEQVVISGPAAAIEAASRLLESSGHRVVRLEVAGAFHHPRLAPASDLLSRHLATEPLGPAAGRVVLSGFSGAPHPADPALAASQLARQLSSEIRFVSCLQWLLDNGADLFIESGPGKVLSGLASRLGDKPAVPIDPDPDQPGGLLRLARALAHLAALGVPVRLSAWESPPEDPPAPTPMTVPLSGANHMKPRPAVAPLPPLAANPAPIAAPSPPAATRQPTKVRSEVPSAMSASQPSPGNAGLAREAMALLARMHEDNARLHRQFLETQESAQRALMALVEGRPAEYLPAAAPVAAVPVAPPPAPLAPAAAVVPSPAPVVPAPVPAAAPARAAAPVPPAPGSATGGRDVLSILRSVISEKTGYPVEALGEDLA